MIDRVKLRELAEKIIAAIDLPDNAEFETARWQYRAYTHPETILALLDALEAADVKNTLLSACLHKAEDERDRLQVALSFWMPAIASEASADGERCANDAMLLMGLDDAGSDCWGDRVLAERDALLEDAGRYRYLQLGRPVSENALWIARGNPHVGLERMIDLVADEAIDAARKE